MKNKIRSPKERDRELDKIWDELVRLQTCINDLETMQRAAYEQLTAILEKVTLQRMESDLEQLTEDAEQLIKDAAKATAEEKAPAAKEPIN